VSDDHAASVAQAVTPDRFRDVLGRFATGVAVMTTLHDGRPHGMTVSAVSSVSLEPPLVLVCVDQGSIMAELVARSGVFALSFLAAAQQPLSMHFADPARPDGSAQFVGLSLGRSVTGSPILPGTTGWVDCRVEAIHPGGDHHIVVGSVVALDDGDADEPLLYHRAAYHRLAGSGLAGGA
jgi:3-hydroxy-9,10-secoandrosta-1,3,5(10)-triene-9,17-dione monooxygenase reductase component